MSSRVPFYSAAFVITTGDILEVVEIQKMR